MTVSDSIAQQYETEYGIRPVTVRNCSRSAKEIEPFTRSELGISENHLLLILQGTGINADRGGGELIEAIYSTENVSLLMVGSGNLLDALKKKANELKLSDRVKFFPEVPWKELMRYTKSADVGISPDKDTNINYRFSLPNKIFDYISAGIPVIASDLHEVSKIIKEHKCGIIIPEVTPEAISKALKEIKNNSGLIAELKQNAVIASESINWEKESIKVTEFYSLIIE